jgi:segregation and condensation protein B
MNDTVKQHIEALIFAANEPITLNDIQFCIEESLKVSLQKLELELLLEQIKDKYASETFIFEPVGIGGGYQFLSKSKYHETIGVHLKLKSKKSLSRAALETISIIAYKQPLSKLEIEQIRGVNSDYAVSKLLEKELIAITGRSDKPGRPLLYGTSAKFMDYFGINSINDLPKLADFKPENNEIGEPVGIEEKA